MLYFFPGIIVFLILIITPIFAALAYLFVIALGRSGAYFARTDNSRINAYNLSTGIAIVSSGLLFLIGLFYAHQAWNCFPSLSGYGTTGACWIDFPLYSKSDSSIESRDYGDALVGNNQQLSYMPVVLEDDEFAFIEALAFKHRCELQEDPYRVDGERNESTYYLACKSGDMEIVCSSLPPNAECWRAR